MRKIWEFQWSPSHWCQNRRPCFHIEVAYSKLPPASFPVFAGSCFVSWLMPIWCNHQPQGLFLPLVPSFFDFAQLTRRLTKTNLNFSTSVRRHQPFLSPLSTWVQTLLLICSRPTYCSLELLFSTFGSPPVWPSLASKILPPLIASTDSELALVIPDDQDHVLGIKVLKIIVWPTN